MSKKIIPASIYGLNPQNQHTDLSGNKDKHTEADVLKAVKKYLKERGFYVIRNQLALGAHKGLSDLQAIKDGQTIYVECKSPKWKGKLNPDQVEFQKQIEDHGGLFFLVDSVYGLDSIFGG